MKIAKDIPEEVSYWVDAFYDIQAIRMETTNRMAALKLVDKEPVKDTKRILAEIKETEAFILKLIKKKIEQLPIWKLWLKNIKGIGPAITGRLTSRIAIENSDTISQLWRFCGQGVVNGEAERKRSGLKIHYDPKLKSTMWLIEECLIKASDSYKKLYDGFKTEEENNNKPVKIKLKEAAGYQFVGGKKITKESLAKTKNKNKVVEVERTPIHIHRRAKRKMVKIFLSHLWIKWREIKGLEISKPYVHDIKNHSQYIEPDEMMSH